MSSRRRPIVARKTSSGYDNGNGDCERCLICVQSIIPKRSQWPIKLPGEFGRKPVDAFIKICEILQVSFVEVQQFDWPFVRDAATTRTTKTLPFCSTCFTGFHSIVKLQQQLFDIQKKIEDKIAGIRELIRQSDTFSNNFKRNDPKAATFRSKAVNRGTCTTANSTLLKNNVSTFNTPSLWSHQQSIFPGHTTSSTTSSVFNPSRRQPDQDISISPNTSSVACGDTIEHSNKSSHQEYENGDDNDDYETSGGANDNLSSEPDSDSENDDDYKNPKVSKRGKSKQSKFSSDAAAAILATLFPPAVHQENLRSTSKKERQPEYFSPVVTTPDGQLVFEGILMIPLLDQGYKCGQCGVIIGKDHSSISLRKTKIHIKGVHLGAYKCDLCGKNMTSNDILSQHLVRFHEDKESPCPTCCKPIKPQNMRHHQFSHLNDEERQQAYEAGYHHKVPEKREPTLPCKICGKKFRSNYRRKVHEIVHVDAEFRKDFKCQICGKGFISKGTRKQHYFAVHDQKNGKKSMCKVCGLSILHKNMGTHMRTHNLLRCVQCEKSFQKPKDYQNHKLKCGQKRVRDDDNYPFECDICKKCFDSNKKLYFHRRKTHKTHWKAQVPLHLMEDVSVDNPREKDILLDDLNNEGIQHVEGNIYSYQLYQVEKLEGVEGYRCCECRNEFCREDEKEDEEEVEKRIKDHVRLAHVGDFRCNRCTKRFKSLDATVLHIKLVHAGKKVVLEGEKETKEEKLSKPVYNCDICGRMGMGGHYIKKHKWMHKNVWEVAEAVNSGEPIPAKFSSSEMERVLKGIGVDVNFKCGLCDKQGFDSAKSLKEHRTREHPDAPVKIIASVVRRGKRKLKSGSKLKRKGTSREKRDEPQEEDSEEFSEEEEEEQQAKDSVVGDSIGVGRRVTTRKRVRILVIADEDEDVSIKREIVTPENSEDDNDEEEWREIEKNDHATKRQRVNTGGRINLRDRSRLKKSSKLADYYKDEDSEDEEH